MILLLSCISGIFSGYSISLGLKPVYEQPKNLIIQILTGLIGIMLMLIILKII